MRQVQRSATRIAMDVRPCPVILATDTRGQLSGTCMAAERASALPEPGRFVISGFAGKQCDGWAHAGRSCTAGFEFCTSARCSRYTDPVAQPLTLEEAIALARDVVRSGDPTNAAGICARILEAAPDQPQPLHLMGLAAFQKGYS